MKTLKELFEYFDIEDINYFISNKSNNVMCISGKHKTLIGDVQEVIDNDKHEFWESFYNNKWTTFIKNLEIEQYVDDEFIEYEEVNSDDFSGKHWEMDAYEYDGDPDKFDDWREGNGY